MSFIGSTQAPSPLPTWEDGGIHRSQIEYDSERDLVLQDMGLQVIRFNNQNVSEQLPKVLKTIRDAIRHQLAHLEGDPDP